MPLLAYFHGHSRDSALARLLLPYHIPAMTAFSVLDLVPVIEGSDIVAALANAADLAAHAERLGYKRYWVAEHHGMPGIGSAATSLVIAHTGAATSTIRLGAGGIMLPNHAPLVIAEQFGTLAAPYPQRIDLGLGRAPGSDQRVATALRRNLQSASNQFPSDVMELQASFAGNTEQTGTASGTERVSPYVYTSVVAVDIKKKTIST